MRRRRWGRLRALFGVRARFAALAVLISLGASASAVWLGWIRETARIESSIEAQTLRTGEVLAQSITAMMFREQLSSIRELAEEVHRRHGGPGTSELEALRYVLVTDAYGRQLYDSLENRSSDAEEDRVLPRTTSDLLTRNGLVGTGFRFERVQDQRGRPVLDLAVPCSVLGVDGKSRTYGLVRLGVALDPLEERWRRAWVEALYASLFSLLLGLSVGLVVSGRMVRSIRSMAEAVHRIARGELSARIRETRSDELGQLARAIDRMAEDLQKRELLKRYISATAWDEIEERGVHLAEDQEVTLKEVTVLFLDIRNYTSFSEIYQSREIVNMLNEVFTILIGVVDEFGGVLDKFIGDALLVVFYPGEDNDDAVRAVYAACRMQEELRSFNQKRRFYGREAISIGVGINTGTVIAGSVGSRERKDYTVIGDPVNVAARLQEKSKRGEHTRVILSQATYDLVASLVEVSPMGEDEIRGKREAMSAYEVISVKGLQAILDGLTDEDPKVQREAFQALEATGGSEALPHLVQVLGGDQHGMILKAIPILARLGHGQDAIRSLLLSLVDPAQDPKILATAVRALGNLRRPEDAAAIRSVLSHEDARVRANAIESLDWIGEDVSLEAVAPLLHDPNQRVKANAAIALFKRGHPDVVRVLTALCKSQDASARASAVFALGELFASESRLGTHGTSEEILSQLCTDLENFKTIVETLRGRLDDEDRVVSEKVVQALVKARDTRVLEDLAQRAMAAEELEQRLSLVSALGRIGTPPRIARLIRSYRRIRSEEERQEGLE